jgi:hypothetical protein
LTIKNVWDLETVTYPHTLKLIKGTTAQIGTTPIYFYCVLATVLLIMKKKVIEALERKEVQMKEVMKLYDDYNNGSKKYTINDISKNEIEINAQISILRHLLS